MTRKEKLDQLAEWIGEASLQSCRSGCGQPYPDLVAVLGDGAFLVVAGLDASKSYSAPDLKVWTGKTAARWHADAVRYMDDNPEAEFWEVIGETEPKPDA